MKKSLVLGSTLGLLLLAGTASAEIVKYKATLNGQQQVPAVETAAKGEAVIEFDTETKRFSGTLTWEGVTPTAAHIHEGACGENNPDPTFDLSTGEEGEELTSPHEFETILEDSEVALLEAGKYYINIHSEAHPGGEIRGQILREDGEEKCPPENGGGGDAGGGGNGDGSGGGNGDGSGGGDGGASSSSGGSTPASTDDGGCSTTASAPGNGLAIALGLGAVLAAMKRGRRRKH